MAELRIDSKRCAGHGRCYTLLPDLFEDDDQGFGTTKRDGQLTDEQMAEAQRATQICPEDAISIET